MNNESISQKFSKLSFALLPIISILNIAILICFKAVDDFKVGLEPLIIWLYFIVVLFYIGIVIFDLITRKEKKVYTIVMSGIAFVSDILYILFFYI